MRITICASLSFTKKAWQIKQELEALGHKILMPFTMELIREGKTSIEKIDKKKKNHSQYIEVIKKDLIRKHYKKIKPS